MPTIHPIVDQLHFTRSEFLRGLKGVTDEQAAHRFLPMNCIAWNVGHMVWQEQRYLHYFTGTAYIYPDIHRDFAYGAPASTPSLKQILTAWRKITRLSEPWLETVNDRILMKKAIRDGKPSRFLTGSLIQRLIYHYWYHLGEISAVRQILGQTDLPQYVGNLDSKAPFRNR